MNEVLLLRLAPVLAAMILVSLAMGTLFRRFGQPKEVGEIVAGLLLGPSLLGGMFPGVYGVLLPPEVSGHLSLLSQVGLVLLLLLIGAEFPFPHVRQAIRGAVAVAAAGIAVPFGLTLLVAPLFVRGLAIAEGQAASFSLLLAVAVSITAIPILGRILRVLGWTHTRIGLLAITAAAMDDVLGWILLSAVVGLLHAGWLVSSLGLACVLGAVVLTAGRLWIARVPPERYARGLPAADLAAVLAATLLLAAASNALGVSSIFGGFLAGVAISFNPAMAKALDQRLHDFVAVFFLPIFFMLTGLRADVRGMGGDPALWGLLLLLLGVACAGKIVPCALAARISGMDVRESLAVGLLMNTRGMMALVVIHLGYELGVFPPPLFFMLVAMTLLTTLLTTPLARRLVPAAVALEKAA